MRVNKIKSLPTLDMSIRNRTFIKYGTLGTLPRLRHKKKNYSRTQLLLDYDK